MESSKDEEGTSPAVCLDKLISYDGSDYAPETSAKITNAAGKIPVTIKSLMYDNTCREKGETSA